ncbi:MAG: DUF4252 domain-containing protein [Bacteroidota bacterium]
MKQYIFLLIGLLSLNLLPSRLHAQNDIIDRLMDQYAENDDFTQIRISPSLIRLFASKEKKGDEKFADAIDQMKGLRLISGETANGYRHFDDVVNSLDRSQYEELMSMKDEDENLLFLVKPSDIPGKVSELIMVIGGQDSFFLMSLDGQLDLESIAKIGESMDIDGMENLERLEELEEDDEGEH